MKVRLAVATVVLFAVGISAAFGLTAASALSTETSAGVFVVRCPFSHQKQVDPIVAPGKMSGHLHDFMGNKSTDSNSTYSSMIAAGTTCGFLADKAGYWTPSLIAPNGTIVKPRTSFAYYRNKPVKYGTTTPFPPDFRLIAGGVGTGPPISGWSCEQDAANMVATPPNCGSQMLVLHVRFPNCSNGAKDSADHRSHVRYAGSTCPSTHPIKLPEIFLHVRYPVPGGSGYKLSDGTVSPHADFWNTWQQIGLEAQVRRCLNVGINCGTLTG
jgi:hypothetical protein